MKFPQSFIEEIKGRVRLSELVGRHIPVRRAGREYHALCPFHKEKTPSFTINDEKGFYHCFGCGAHGDVIGFTMEYEHLNYPEAVERLAGQVGLSVPRETIAMVEREAKQQSLQQVVEVVASWLEEQLATTREADVARDYLRERGLKPETIARFRLGYAPADRDALARAMQARGITIAQLIESGMLIQVEGRAPYSRFRRRLMFPIRDRKSRVIAFGGRVLPGEPNDDAPKYLNSPETPLFHKGRQLYNLDSARRAALDAGQLILAEGYMDVIALAQGGIAHAVAPLGTAITPEQLQLCWHLVDAPTLCLDGDNAGQRAMARASELALPLLAPGKTLQFAVMPRGEDPDSLLRHQGRAAFEEVMAHAAPLVEVLWQQAFASAAHTPEARAAQEAALMSRVEQIKHPTVQHYYRQHFRERLRAQAFATRQAMPRNAERGSWKGKGGSGAASGGPVVPLPRPHTASQVPATSLLALAIAAPSLLEGAQAEEFWLHAPMPLSWQQQVHHLITELRMETPEIPHETLWQTVQEESSPEAVRALHRAFEVLGVPLEADVVARESVAQRLWGEVVNDVARAHLAADCAEAETALATDLTEENFARLTALKAQLEALERERSRFYREDPVGSNMGGV